MTAIEMIMKAAFIRWDQPIKSLIGFEALPWICVMYCAGRQINFNDGRFPNIRPDQTSI